MSCRARIALQRAGLRVSQRLELTESDWRGTLARVVSVIGAGPLEAPLFFAVERLQDAFDLYTKRFLSQQRCVHRK